MRRSLFIIVAAVFIFQIYYSESFAYQNEIGTVTSEIAKNMDKVGRKRVAVTDFTDSKGNITDLGKYLADETSSSLKDKAKGFEVLERAELNSILAKYNYSLTTPFDSGVIKQVGEAAKVGAVVTGTITAFENSIRVTVNLVSTYIPKIIISETVEIQKSERILELLGAAGIGAFPAAQPIGAADNGAFPAVQPTPDIMNQETFQAVSNARIEHKGLVFELKECRALDKSTVCGFIVTSEKKTEYAFRVDDASSLYDETGNNYRLYQKKLGGDDRMTRTILVPRSPENGNLVFEKVPENVGTVNFTVVLSDSDGDVYKASFRSVPVAR